VFYQLDNINKAFKTFHFSRAGERQTMMNFHLPPIGGGEGLDRIATGAIGKIENLTLNAQIFTLVELPYEIGIQKIIPILGNNEHTKYALTEPLNSSIWHTLFSFLDLKQGNPNNQDLALTDLIGLTSESYDAQVAKATVLDSRRRNRTYAEKNRGNTTNGIDYSHYHPINKDRTLPVYRVCIAQSSHPEGGFYKIGLQFGTIPASRTTLDKSHPITRDLDAEAELAQQLINLFKAVAKYQ
jgi:hypothetical protein